jgi:hypothetical protein
MTANLCFTFVSMESDGFVLEVVAPNCQMKISVQGTTGAFDVIVHTQEQGGCTACPLGEMHASTTDCACVAIPTEPVLGQLFQAHEFAVNTEHTYELNAGDMFTIRQWAVDGNFPYVVDLSPTSDLVTQMQCIAVEGTPFSNEWYAQASFKALDTTADCHWSMEMRSPDGTNFLKFNLVVKASAPAGPTVIEFNPEITEYHVDVGTQMKSLFNVAGF